MHRSRPPIVVTYCESPAPGGVTAIVATLLSGIRRDVRHILICSDDGPIREWASAVRADVDELHHAALRNADGLTGWFDLPRLVRIARIFRRADIVHLHLHTPFACLPAALLARACGVRRVLATEHYITSLSFLRRRPLPRLLRWVREVRIALQMALKRLSLPAIHWTIAVSSGNADFMRRTFGIMSPDRVRVIDNGIHPPLSARRIPASGLPSAVTHGRTPTHVLTMVAGMNHQKGHHVLLEALPAVLREFPGALLLLVGDGHLRRDIESRAHELGLADSVSFAGQRSDVAVILASTDVVVLPSFFEGMPVSLLEAMFAGVPVVATDVAGSNDVVIDGLTGFLVPPGNPGELGRKILQLLKDPGLRRLMGDRGRERALTRFTAQQMCSAYHALYTTGGGRTTGI